jgi:hypothetical protein
VMTPRSSRPGEEPNPFRGAATSGSLQNHTLTQTPECLGTPRSKPSSSALHGCDTVDSMAFQFDGFFCCGDETVLQAALAKWPSCAVRKIEEPFRGIGLACAQSMDARTEEEATAIANQIREVRSSLVGWSLTFPEVTFIYLTAECAGGPCLYGGYACRDGVVLLEEPINDDDDWEASRIALRRLLKFLGIEGDCFEPLSRGYFESHGQ